MCVSSNSNYSACLTAAGNNVTSTGSGASVKLSKGAWGCVGWLVTDDEAITGSSTPRILEAVRQFRSWILLHESVGDQNGDHGPPGGSDGCQTVQLMECWGFS